METILIVDDENAILEMVSESVSGWGYRTIVARSGADAFEKLRDMPVDLLLTDLRMPKMDGMKLLERVKEISPNTLVIIFTGYGTIENAVDAIKAGANDYLLKPLDLDELRRKIERAFKEQSITSGYSMIRALNWALIISIPIWLILMIILIRSF